MHCLSLIATDTTVLGLLYLIPQTAPATKHLLWFSCASNISDTMKLRVIGQWP